MSLKIKNKLSNKTISKVEEPIEGYTCIGAYEDKPKNRIYYFLHSDPDSGLLGKYDCIVEYDQFNNSSTIVYQDGRKGSNGLTENILNFSKSHLITGVDKVEDTLYFTDNLNRPRKINVERAKLNEARINSAPRFGRILKEMGGDVLPTTTNDSLVNGSPSTGGFFLNKARVYSFASRGETSTKNVLLINVDDNNPFIKNDDLYVQQSGVFTTTESSYNGYSKAVGIVKPFGLNSSAQSITTTTGSSDVTGVGTEFLNEIESGDYICIVLDETIGSSTVRVPHIYEVLEVLSNTSLKLVNTWHTTGSTISTESLNLKSWDTSLNTNNAIITNSPATLAYGSNGGKVLYANPEDAYSPLISFGTHDDKVKYIDALARQPKDKPNFSFSKTSSTLNHLTGKFFQFRYRYIYKDGSVSAYSGISDVANQTAYASFSTNADINSANRRLYDTINVEYNDDISFVDKIEIVARDGNKGEFFLIGSIKNNFIKYLKKRKNQELITSPSSYFGGSSQLDVAFSKLKFTNDSVYSFVDTTDLDKLQDSLPKKAKAQIILPKNRLAYGNVVDGYDNTDIYCSMSFESSDSIDSSEEDLQPTLSVVTLGAPNSETVLKFEFNLSGLTTFDNSIGTKILNIDLKWNKLLFQNHAIGAYYHQSSFVPRGGTFNCTSSIFSPLSIDDIGESIVNDINIFNISDIGPNSFSYHIVDSGGQLNPREVETEPSSVLASYSNQTLSITFTYTSEKNDQLDTEVNSMFVHSPTFPYSETDEFGLQEQAPSDGDYFTDNSFYKNSSFFGNSYKAGANHAFGLVYYDETNRCSFVNKSKPINKFNSGTKIYSPFYSERNTPQSTFNRVSWKIYHRPPEWATHYQWVYGGNTSVDEFVQIPIHAAYKGDSDNKIYLSLGSLKGEDLSYNEENPSLIDYQYVEGDRIRFISFDGDSLGDEGSRKYFKDYIDVPISSYDLYTVEDLNDVLDSSASYTNVIPGYYIVIKNPADSTGLIEFSPANQTSDSYSTADISYTNLNYTSSSNGYHRLVVEIYRPKKSVQTDDTGVYYEVGDKLEIADPGTNSRRHQGQVNNFFFDIESGIEVTAKDTVNGIVDKNGDPTTNYASGVLESGDTYTRSRRISHYRDSSSSDRDLTTLNCESYYLNDFYESNNWNKGRINIENPYSEERRLTASVYYSDTFSSTTSYNGLSSFNFTDISASPYYDYNQDFGSIQSLMLRGDDLIIFHENKVCRVLVGKNIVNYADGDSNVTLSNQVLSDYAQVYSGNNGCSLNPESIAKYKDRFYFVDIKRGAIMRLSADGLTRISDYGLSQYLRDKGELYMNFNPEETTDGEFKIIAGYDSKYDEYVVTLPAIVESVKSNYSGQWDSNSSGWDVSYDRIKNLQLFETTSYATISYNESLNKWTSFYSYNPEFYSRINRQFVTFKNGHLYKQNSSVADFNTFYGETHGSVIDFPFNSEVSSVKTYNAISLEGDTKLLTQLYTNMGQYNDSDRYSVSTIIRFKKIDGSVSSNLSDAAQSIIVGSEDSNFYNDLAPGDLVRIYNDEESGTPEHRVIREIISKNKARINDSIDEPFSNVKVEVIDYKTKEGTQYSQIPFVPSKINNYEGSEFEGNYDGDASNIFGLGHLSSSIQGSSGILTDNSNSGVIKNLPFKGSKVVNSSQVITGANYITLSGSERSGTGYNALPTGRSGLDNSLISTSVSRFNNSSDWTVVSSGAFIQSDTMGRKGNVALFEKKSTPPEIRTTSALSYKSGENFKVSFYVDTLDNSDGDAVIEVRLGKITNKITRSNKKNPSYGYYSSRKRNKLTSTKELVSFNITAGDSDNDPHLYIRSSKSSGSFSISNLSVVKAAPVRSNDLIFPAEYSLYCLDSSTGVSTHEGWVYNITDNEVYYKVINSDGRSGYRSSNNYADRSRLSSKFYFIVKDGLVDGEKLKGHFLKTRLTSHQHQSKYKFNLYSANIDVDKSELSGNK